MRSPGSLRATDVVRARQVALLLGEQSSSGAEDVVTWLGALQAQDLASGCWSLGVRIPGSTVAEIDAALESGAVLRTWSMRGTIHLVPGRDAQWMLALSRERQSRQSSARRRDLDLDDHAVDRASDALRSALRGGNRLARAEAMAVLRSVGVPTTGQAGYHVLVHVAQRGVICIGPNADRHQTFVLLDEWAPDQVTMAPHEALAELAWRYFRSHGPTTVSDFAGWSGATLTQSRAAALANGDRLVSAEFEGRPVWMSRDVAESMVGGVPAQPARALPGFDEFILGYKDRTVQVPAAHLEAIVPGGNGVFRSTICIDGRAIATWTRTVRRDRIDVAVLPFDPLTAAERTAVDAAITRYGEFVGLPVRQEV